MEFGILVTQALALTCITQGIGYRATIVGLREIKLKSFPPFIIFGRYSYLYARSLQLSGC